MSLDSLRRLDAVAGRYGKLPHELIPDFPDDEYIVWCFNEAVALAGLSLLMPASKANGSNGTQVPTNGAFMGLVNGVPVISGKVPVVRGKRG